MERKAGIKTGGTTAVHVQTPLLAKASSIICPLFLGLLHHKFIRKRSNKLEHAIAVGRSGMKHERKRGKKRKEGQKILVRIINVGR